MFRRSLRQLQITIRSDGQIDIKYKCRLCLLQVIVTLTDSEWTDLKNGIPFNAVFYEERREKLIHFRQGRCNEHCSNSNT